MSRVRSIVASMLMSPVSGHVTRSYYNNWRRLTGKPHTVIFYHRVADAWSGLLAQILGHLLADYDVQLQIRLVSALPIDCVPDPYRLDQYAAYDAMRLAHVWGLSFPDDAQTAEQNLVHLAERIILAQPGNNIAIATAVTSAVWARDSSVLSKMAATCGAVEEQQADVMLRANLRDLHRRGHYQGGMLWFQGEFFWGLDRLYLLEERLRSYRLNRREEFLHTQLFRPLNRAMAGSASPMDLEWYFSFRSPYSYLAALPVAALADRLGLNLILRPVMPMVARGIPVPWRKLRYIIQDAARVARYNKLPFGPIRDPLGKGVERCLAVFHLAKTRGVERQFMQAAMQAIWTQAADMTRNHTLQRVVSQAGLSWPEAEKAIESASWRAQVEANGAALAVLGLWGVPGMCLRGPDDLPVTVAWGQDRLWAIERAALGLDVAMPPPRLVQ